MNERGERREKRRDEIEKRKKVRREIEQADEREHAAERR